MPDPPGPHERLVFDIHRQPDDDTCGPTCLHAVYRFFGEDVSLEDVLREVPTVAGGGTLGVLLANHALARGFGATIVTWNLQVFDPTWFREGAPALRERLLLRADTVADEKLARQTRAYVDFLDGGGRIELRDLEPALLKGYLQRGLPVLTGLSATFLYREPREGPGAQPDDVAGDPVGHFVVLTGYAPASRSVYVTDPLHPNPLSRIHTYPVAMQRVIGAIYLGVLTYDANLVVIEPKEGGGAHDRRRQ